jgi:hypothetical protein
MGGNSNIPAKRMVQKRIKNLATRRSLPSSGSVAVAKCLFVPQSS